MIAIIFSFILFFVAMFYLFQQVLVTAAITMAFSVLWFVVGAWYHKFELIFNTSFTKEENS